MSPLTAFVRIDPKEDAILRNLYEHYVHDMSEWFGIDVGTDGKFAYDTSPLWRGDFAVFLARVDEKLAGFAVVGSAERWLGESAARDVKDFFVLRAYRHKRVADSMAHYIWKQFPAQWLVRVLTTNRPAVSFWRRAVREQVGAAHVERQVGEQDREWIHLSFDNRQS